jgi:D-lactate dehydrogenase
MIDAMCYEVFAEEEEVLRRLLPAHVHAQYTSDTIQVTQDTTPPARLITTRTQSVVPRGWLPHLEGILTRSSGYDHLLGLRDDAPQMPYGYLPLYCARAVAEQAILLYLALARKLSQQLSQFTTFSRDGITGGECLGRDALVVGVGPIGTELVHLAQGMGMRVRGVDLVPQLQDLEYVTLADGLSQADVIFCALPLTEITHGMLNWERLRHVKSGAIFINISRGEIAPIHDLQRLLQEEILSGIGLDVYEEESTLAEELRAGRGQQTALSQAVLMLQQDPRVLCTPHNAFNTREALQRKAQQSSEAITTFLTTGVFPHPLP